MKKIGLISDTHNMFDDRVRKFLADVDEIWHAGDIGSIELADNIAKFKPLRAVYGNVDGGPTRVAYKAVECFECEGVRVVMTHIGGYPGRYQGDAYTQIIQQKPKLFISGHSHILKVMYDKKYDLLHINPGAAGQSGFHQVRTAVRFLLGDGEITELEVGQWPKF